MRDAAAGDRTPANPLIRVIEDATRFYMESYHGLGHGYVAHLHDPLAAAVALDPQLVATQPATVDVELTGHPDPRHDGNRLVGTLGSKAQRLIGVGVDPMVFFDRFIEAVGPFASRLG